MSHSPLALRADVAALLPRLRRLARIVAAHREDADDLVRTTVERAVHRLDPLPADARLDRWLFRVMANAWADDDGLAPDDPGHDDGAPADRLSIEAAMARVPVDQRMAIGLVLVEGLPCNDAAKVLDVPADTLARRLAHGRDALRRLLGDTDVDTSSSPATDGDRIALQAYVDGEMPEAELIAFEARLALDVALFDAVAHERALRATLAAHYDAVLDEPMPDGLLDLLAMPAEPADDAPPDWPASRAANDSTLAAPPAVVPIRRAAAERASAGVPWQAWVGMAACLVLGIVLGARVLGPTDDSTPPVGAALFAIDDKGGLTADGALRTALDEQAGGSSIAGARGVAIGLSFRDKSRDYCRTFAVDTSSGIACKSGGGWVVVLLEHAPATAAASTTSPALLRTVAASRDGDTLDAAGEAAARAKDWRH